MLSSVSLWQKIKGGSISASLYPAALRPSHAHCTSMMDGGAATKLATKKKKKRKNRQKKSKGGQSRVETAHCPVF